MNALTTLFVFALVAYAAAVPTSLRQTIVDISKTENPHPSSSSFPNSPVPAPQALISAVPAAAPSVAPSLVPVAKVAPSVSTKPSPVRASPAASTAAAPTKAAVVPTPAPSKAAPPSPAASLLPGQSPSVSPSVAASPVEPLPADPVAPGIADAGAASPEPEATSEGRVCFPADATVVLESGEVVEMENLQIGHRVQVGASQFSDVVMFTHALPNVKHTFVKLTTTSGKTVRATEGHYIYADSKLTRMGDVVLGNTLRTSSGTDEKVVNIARQTSRGLFNPQTAHGDIIVDGIRASTYTETIPNKAAHAMLAPVRAAFEWTAMRVNVLEKIVW